MPAIAEEIEQFLAQWRSERPFIVAHTSGSTGKPKEIHLPKKLMEESAMRSIRFFGIGKESRLHLCLSPSYIAGKMLILRALLSGARLTYEPPSLTPLSEPTDSEPITLISIVGSQLDGLINSLNNSHIAINHLLLGGSALTPSMRQKALSTGCQNVWESYGMTETASHIALRRVTPAAEAPFEALPGITVSTNPEGCLRIEMPTLGTLQTNDIAEITAPGQFRIIGRKDSVIISGGIKIQPEEIEAAIAPATGGRAYYITSRKSEKWVNEVILIIEGEPTELPDLSTLISDHRKRPKAIIFVPRIERTDSGKIIRRKW